MNTLPPAERKRPSAIWRAWLEAEGINHDKALQCVKAFRNPAGVAKHHAEGHARDRALRKLRPAIEELQKVLNMPDPEDALNWCIAMAKRETRYSDAA